ncbi:MAG: hypothetical protein ACQEQM_07295 [Thermoplasmatota archaeon]
MIEELGNSLSTHAYEIFMMIAIVVIIYFVSSLIRTYINNKNSVKMAEYAIKGEKLDMVKKQTELRELSDAAIVLNDSEKERLDSINNDVSVLSRKNISLMKEVESRTSRLERGTDMAMMKKQIEKIREQENKLFGKNKRR